MPKNRVLKYSTFDTPPQKKAKKQNQNKKTHKIKNSNHTWVLITILMFNINHQYILLILKLSKKKSEYAGKV